MNINCRVKFNFRIKSVLEKRPSIQLYSIGSEMKKSLAEFTVNNQCCPY